MDATAADEAAETKPLSPFDGVGVKRPFDPTGADASAPPEKRIKPLVLTPSPGGAAATAGAPVPPSPAPSPSPFVVDATMPMSSPVPAAVAKRLSDDGAAAGSPTTFNFSRVAAAVDASIAWLDDGRADVDGRPLRGSPRGGR